ncbi:hypothetical protein Tco_0988307 [Tanacetum coccineum]|uniref:CCHC-type domain-containing protein n=1 Tax=Tanacetum coccineum TaxID=301880 RepID=A0ABQ5ERB4_9ASTR
MIKPLHIILSHGSFLKTSSAAVDICKTTQEILRVQQMMKGSDIGIQDKKAKLFNEWERFTSTDGESIESYYHHFSKLMNDFKRNKHFPEKIASNLKFLNNLQPEWRRHVTIVHQTKDLHEVDYTQLYDFLKYNQAEVNELRAERLARAHDPLALMANSNTLYNYPVFHQDQPLPVTYMQQPQLNNNFNPQPSFNTNYMQQPMPNPEDITDPTTAMNMALVLMAKAFKLNYSTPTNNNQRISSNPHNRQIAQPGMNLGQDRQMQMVRVQNLGIQNVGNQNGLIVVPGIANQNLNPNGNGNVVAARAEGNANRNNGNQIRCYNCRGLGHLARNLTVRPKRRDVAYLQTQLLIAQKEEVGIQLQAKDFDLMAAAGDLDEIEEVNANCILMANLQQASTSSTQTDKAPVYDSDGSAEGHEYDNCYNNDILNMFTQEEQYTELLDPIPEPHQSVYQDQCLTKKINALHLISAKMITNLNEKISNLNNQLSKEKLIVFSLQEEKKKLKSDFKIREDKLLDKQIQLENKIKELDNILVKTGQSIQTMHMLSPKPDSFYHTEQKMALGYQNLFYLKQAQQKQQSLYNGKVLLEKHDPPAVYDSEETLQLALESRLKMKQLNKEIKPTNYAKINHLLEVFVSQKAKSREELYFSNTSKMASVSKSISIPSEEFSDDTSPSVARKFLNELLKIVKDKIYPIVNQVDARVQNFEIQFLKKAAKFVRDFNSLANKADESLAKHKSLELKIERLLRAVVSQDIMSIVQNPTVVETSDLQTELDPYKDMQQKIKRLQAHLGDLKGNSEETPCVSDTLDSFSHKLENENVSEQKDTLKGTSANTKFANQSNLGKPLLPPLRNHSVVQQPNAFQSERPKRVPPKVAESNDLLNSVTSNSVPTPTESKVVTNDKVIALGMFRINPFKTSREDKFVRINKVRASVRTNPITVSQPHVLTKKDVNSNSNGLSSTGVDITTKTRRPQSRSNTKNDRVSSASKSSCITKNKEVEVEEHHRNLLLSKNKKHMSSECKKVSLLFGMINLKLFVLCVSNV